METVKESRFPDYWGIVKSLGAWGGDFVMVTSNKSLEETCTYFESNGHSIVIPYDEIILAGSEEEADVTNNEYLQ